MTLEQIQYFIVTCEELNLSNAAERLYVNHSSVSRSITSLEKELGVQLLIRTRHSVTMTEIGSYCYGKCMAIMNQIEEMKTATRHFLSRDSLRVGTVSGLSHEYYGIFRQFTEANPKLHVSYEYNPQSALIDGLIRGDYDLCMAFEYINTAMPEKAPDMNSIKIDSGRFRVITSVNHELAKQKRIRYSDLLKRPDMMSREVTEMLSKESFSRQEYRQVSAANDLSASDFTLRINTENCVFVVPEHITESLGKNCAVLDIEDAEIKYNLCLFYIKKNDNPALQAFLKQVSPLFGCNLTSN